MNEPVLTLDNLSIALPAGADRASAVDGVSLNLRRGEILCVVGESGSGKSMCAHAIMGLLPKGVGISGGRILFESADIATLDDVAMRRLRGSRLGMIFQEPMTALNPLMRIGDQIGEVFEAHGGLSAAEQRARTVALLGEVGLPEPERVLRAYPFQLSGGQRQRVMIAMALALEPAVLIADEPTTALDVTTQAQILALIKALQERHGTAVLFITHDFGVVAEIADEVAVLQHGRLVETGPADAVLGNPQADYTKSLLAAVPSLVPPPPAPVTGGPLLIAENIRKTYVSGGSLFAPARRVAAADDVSLTIARGETLGLVGESGSGKSTLGRCLIRLIEPDSGRISLDGADVTTARGQALLAQRKRIQMIFQDPYASLNPRLRVGQIIADGPIAHGVPRTQAWAKARELLTLVGLGPQAAERFPHEFSGGQRQRIGIARALALEPDILVADEPVSALDVSVQAQVLALIADLKKRLSLSILFITHDLRVAAQVCDRIAVMQKGRIVETGLTAQIFATPQHEYTRRLLGAVPGAGRLHAGTR